MLRDHQMWTFCKRLIQTSVGVRFKTPVNAHYKISVVVPMSVERLLSSYWDQFIIQMIIMPLVMAVITGGSVILQMLKIDAY